MTDPIRWGDRMLHFGDPLDCDHRWIQPSRLDDYATSVRLVGRKVAAAAEALDLAGRLGGAPSDTGEGLTAEAMRERGLVLRDELTRTRSSVRGVATAMHDYADALRTYRDDLRDLRDHAVTKGLDVRSDKVFAPVTTPPHGGTRAAERWEDDWRSYSVCFEWMRAARARRREALQELQAALLEHAGVRPRAAADRPDPVKDAGEVGHGNGSGAAAVDDVRRLRRDAARAAAEALRADADAQEGHQHHRDVRAQAARAAEELAALRRGGADADTLEAKAAELHDLEERAVRTGVEAGERAAAAERLRTEAHEAGRDHQEATDRRAGRAGTGAVRLSAP